MAMKVLIGADHRGFKLKEQIKDFLYEQGHEVADVGADSEIPNDDYVDYALAIGESLSEGMVGILICGSGAGVDIAANKIKGIRSVLGFDTNQVKAAKQDDNVNVLSLASDYISFEAAKELVSTFLSSEFNPTENHVRRLKKITSLE